MANGYLSPLLPLGIGVPAPIGKGRGPLPFITGFVVVPTAVFMHNPAVSAARPRITVVGNTIMAIASAARPRITATSKMSDLLVSSSGPNITAKIAE